MMKTESENGDLVIFDLDPTRYYRILIDHDAHLFTNVTRIVVQALPQQGARP